MKRKAAKLISLILTAALIFSCQIFTAFAEELEGSEKSIPYFFIRGYHHIEGRRQL